MRLVTPGRGLVVDDEHRLVRMGAVFGQPGLDDGRVDATAPVAGHEVDGKAELLRHRAPQRREMAGFEHQHAIARRKRIHQRRLPRSGAGRGKDDDRSRGLEDRLQALEDFQRQPRELGTAMVDRRLVHRAQDPVGYVRRPGDLQEMAAGRVRVELEHDGLRFGAILGSVDVTCTC